MPENERASHYLKGSAAGFQPPNLPEVSGTSFPVLTTVLAGFAVTIAVQLIIRPDATDDLGARLIAAIIVFLASTLLFIVSIVFGVNAQSYNYLPFLELGENSRRILAAEDYGTWIFRLKRRWEAFHVASLATFYGAILLLLGGVNLIVWEFIGAAVAITVLAIILASLVLTLSVSFYVDRLEPELKDEETGGDTSHTEKHTEATPA